MWMFVFTILFGVDTFALDDKVKMCPFGFYLLMMPTPSDEKLTYATCFAVFIAAGKGIKFEEMNDVCRSINNTAKAVITDRDPLIALQETLYVANMFNKVITDGDHIERRDYEGGAFILGYRVHEVEGGGVQIETVDGEQWYGSHDPQWQHFSLPGNITEKGKTCIQVSFNDRHGKLGAWSLGGCQHKFYACRTEGQFLLTENARSPYPV
ncbi:hypothetical protein AB6A40_002640 [Gnathostoma spinigerum]|uniref:C-type lectin domain-containing protein n=1 Tax=Gnathostoma spinigerum TaxID=75299 RepID=A0ABD6E9Q3_9BILA